MAFVPNGRTATQSDLNQLEQRLGERLGSIDRRLTGIEVRMRTAELEHAREDGESEAVRAARSTERTVLRDRVAGNRWRVGIAVAIGSIVVTNVISLVALIR